MKIAMDRDAMMPAYAPPEADSQLAPVSLIWVREGMSR